MKRKLRIVDKKVYVILLFKYNIIRTEAVCHCRTLNVCKCQKILFDNTSPSMIIAKSSFSLYSRSVLKVIFFSFHIKTDGWGYKKIRLISSLLSKIEQIYKSFASSVMFTIMWSDLQFSLEYVFQ